MQPQQESERANSAAHRDAPRAMAWDAFLLMILICDSVFPVPPRAQIRIPPSNSESPLVRPRGDATPGMSLGGTDGNQGIVVSLPVSCPLFAAEEASAEQPSGAASHYSEQAIRQDEVSHSM